MSDPGREALERWLAVADAAAESGAGALATLRREGRAALAATGFPSVRDEEWRYTNPAPLLAVDFARADDEPPALSRERLEELASPVYACGLVVLVNGRGRQELSGVSIGDVEVGRLAETAPSGLGSLVDAKLHPFAALNAACVEDGVLVRIPAGAQLEHPVHVVFASASPEGSPRASHPRVFIEAGPGSRAVVVCDHVSLSGEAHFTNAVAELSLGEDASLELVTLQREGDACFHLSNVAVRQERDARFASHVVTLGGRLVRNDLSVLLAGPGAGCRLNGLFLGTGSRVVDNHTLVDHAVPHGNSDELYKGVLLGRSRGVFRGRVVVRPDAQKTDARQSNPNLLLTDGAEIDTKPQLEIYADDVKCSHGSAIGRIDPDALFYLRSRGIPEREARAVLTRGFAQQVLAALPGEALAEALGAAFAEIVEREALA